MKNKKSTEYLLECRVALDAEQARSLIETDNWSHIDRKKVHADWDVLYAKIAPLIDRTPPSSSEVQAMMSEHYRIVSRFYAPSKRAYIGMSLFYGEDTDMLAFHSSYHPNMVPFLAEAMLFYAEAHL